MNQILKQDANKHSELQTEVTTSPDRFQFKEVIGRGGMATVYRAFDTQTQRDVAVKVLYDHLREHSLVVEHFRREVAIAQRLEHPNIVRIHSLLETPDTLGLVMELHGDGDLKNYLQRHGAMPHKLVVEIGVQVLTALQSAHDQGIIHLDIKPHNILWDPLTQTAKLIDFGLAQTEQIIALARPESAMGTVEYSAPEQFDDFSTDARADLYSLAITLFELLSNNLPYRSETAAGVIQMHREAPPADVRIFTRGIPAHIAETLLRAMAKTPEDRFANAHEMSQALQNQASTELTVLPRSKVWDTLKKAHASNPEPNNWNVYIPPSQFSDFNEVNTLLGTAYRRELFKFVQKHGTYLSTERATTFGNIQINPDTMNEADFDFIFIDKSIMKNPRTLMRENNVYTRKLEPIAVACNLTLEQAEAIRYDLGRSSIPAKIFQKDVITKSAPDYHEQRMAFSEIIRFNLKFTSKINDSTLVFAGFFIFLILFSQLAVGSPLFVAAPLILVLAVAGLTLSNRGTNFQENFGFHAHWELGKLNFDNFYLLDFAPNKTQRLTSDLISEKHAEIYHQLRSNRVRASFERIILTLLNTANRADYKDHAQKVLNQATHIATRVTVLEARQTAQDQSALFAQLARLDTLLAQTDDTDQSAELIEQRTALHQQLKQLDRDREELNNLNQQLLNIASSLDQFS